MLTELCGTPRLFPHTLDLSGSLYEESLESGRERLGGSVCWRRGPFLARAPRGGGEGRER